MIKAEIKFLHNRFRQYANTNVDQQGSFDTVKKRYKFFIFLRVRITVNYSEK